MRHALSQLLPPCPFLFVQPCTNAQVSRAPIAGADNQTLGRFLLCHANTHIRINCVPSNCFVGPHVCSSHVVVLGAGATFELSFPLAAALADRDGQRQSSQNDLNRSGDSSVYRTVCWMFLCPR